MGRGDKRTAKGKRFKGSFGNSRKHKIKAKVVVKTAAPKKVKEVAPKVEAEVKPKPKAKPKAKKKEEGAAE